MEKGREHLNVGDGVDTGVGVGDERLALLSQEGADAVAYGLETLLHH